MLDPGAGCSRPLSFCCAGVHSFVAESEREKREWMEALQEAIAEMLYDYEVAEKIWSNKANKHCADCWAPSPDWASINLCVVICKQCAGQYISHGDLMGVGRGCWLGCGCDLGTTSPGGTKGCSLSCSPQGSTAVWAPTSPRCKA